MRTNSKAVTDIESEKDAGVLERFEVGDGRPLHPADSSGTRFVLRSRDDEPWVPLSFGQLSDDTPYVYLSGRVTPRVG